MLSRGLVVLAVSLVISVFLPKLKCIPSIPGDGSPLTGLYGVSVRELDVFNLVCQGKTNREIADALCISMATVKTHLSHLFEKTGVRNRVELVNVHRLNDAESTFRLIDQTGRQVHPERERLS